MGYAKRGVFPGVTFHGKCRTFFPIICRKKDVSFHFPKLVCKYRPHSGNRLGKPDSFDTRVPLFMNTSISFSPERKKSRKLTPLYLQVSQMLVLSLDSVYEYER